MKNDTFATIISDAKNGNERALLELIELYMPLINKFSMVNGRLDEDLRQTILLEIISSISRFEL